MGGRDLAISVAFAAMVVGMSYTLARPRTETDQAGAVEATIKYIVGEVENEISRMEGKDSEMGEMTLCLDTSELVVTRDVAKNISSKLVKITPIEHCSNKNTGESLGTHGLVTDYFDKNGGEAVFVKLTDLECGVRDLCSISIYHSYFHFRYNLVKLSGKWTVTPDD